MYSSAIGRRGIKEDEHECWKLINDSLLKRFKKDGKPPEYAIFWYILNHMKFYHQIELGIIWTASPEEVITKLNKLGYKGWGKNKQ